MFPETFSLYMLAVLFFGPGLLFLPPPLIRFPSQSWHFTMLPGQFLCESTVKYTGGCTINPNLGLWFMQVYVNSCICFFFVLFCIVYIYSEGLFQRDEGGQNLWTES